MEFAESELTSPDPTPPPESFTVQDLESSLQDDGPDPSASLDDLANAARRWHGILVHVGKQKTVLAWRIGRALTYAQAKVKHGEWYRFLSKEFPSVSKPTLWRYLQLYTRSPKEPPKVPLTDAYVAAGIVNEGRNTVEEYVYQLRVLVSKIWKLTRTVRAIARERGALLNIIDPHDLVDADGHELFRFEAGLNLALIDLADAVETNPDINLFDRFEDEIGPAARHEVLNHVGKSLWSPFDEHHGRMIPSEAIPKKLMDPDVVERWEKEHREAVKRNDKHTTRDRALRNLERMQEMDW